jgi:hypothetical protein
LAKAKEKPAGEISAGRRAGEDKMAAKFPRLIAQPGATLAGKLRSHLFPETVTSPGLRRFEVLLFNLHGGVGNGHRHRCGGLSGLLPEGVAQDYGQQRAHPHYW